MFTRGGGFSLFDPVAKPRGFPQNHELSRGYLEEITIFYEVITSMEVSVPVICTPQVVIISKRHGFPNTTGTNYQLWKVNNLPINT